MSLEEAWDVRALSVDKSFKFESPGFENLFGRGEERHGCPVIGSSDGQLLGPARALGMSEEGLPKKLKFLETYAELEQRDVLCASPSTKVGCSLQLAQNQRGDVFVSQLTTFIFKSSSGGNYSVSIHEDATSMCSVGRLLNIAGTGEYFELLRPLHKQLRFPEAARRLQQLEALLQDLLRELVNEEHRRELELVNRTEDLEGASEGSSARMTLSRMRKLATQRNAPGKAAVSGQAAKDIFL